MTARPFIPMIKRIYEVLIDGAGEARTLSLEDRYGGRFYPGQPPSQGSRDAHVRRQVWVQATDIDPIAAPERRNRAAYALTIQVASRFYLPPPGLIEEWRERHGDAADHAHIVRGALAYPGNLRATEDGDPTGLQSACLVFTGWRIDSFDEPSRLLETTGLYRAHVDATF